MVRLRNLKAKDFSKLLSNYNIGRYQRHKLIDYPLENSDYFIATNQGRFFLKIFERSKLADVKQMVKIEEYLHSKKVKVPRILKTKENENIFLFRQKPVVIYEYLEGIYSKKLTRNLTIDIANKIGLLHKNLLKSKIKYTRGLPLANRLIDKMSLNSNKFVKSEHEKLKIELNQIKYSKLRKTVIHGDLFGINFLVKKDKLLAFIDWDDSHFDYLVFDLAVLFVHTFMSFKRMKKDKIKLFMKYYSKYVKLNTEEKKAIFSVMRIRLLAVILWHEKMKKQHKDKQTRMSQAIATVCEQYKILNRLTPDKFLKFMKY